MWPSYRLDPLKYAPVRCSILNENIFVKSSKFSDEINWRKCLRFSLYGSLFVAPTLYCWVRIAHSIFPRLTLTSTLKKVALEQITYGPLSLSAFFLFMTYTETGNFDRAKDELRAKFLDTYKVCHLNFFFCYSSRLSTNQNMLSTDCHVFLAGSTNDKLFCHSGSQSIGVP